MNIQRTSVPQRGFTLMELMVAMAITSIIVTVLVSVTSVALDTWNRSRSELRASRQAKAMIDTMSRDFESLVSRRGNTSEWLSAVTDPQTIGTKLQSTNASKLIFFTSVGDRYNGQIGVSGKDLGGDVSCAAYQLEYKNAINPSTSGYETFILRRLLVDPDVTFSKLLGKTDLAAAFSSAYPTQISDSTNFVCENVYQFSVTFNVQVTQVVGGNSTLVNVPVTVGKTSSAQTTKSFRILGTGITTDVTGGTASAAEIAAGKLTSMQFSLTVISDFGIDQLRSRTFSPAQQADFLAKNSYQYTKSVTLPSM